ncbi:MAG: hypothetical protein WC561_03135 [Candidatus Omnitrophota bacterium]
MKIRRIFILLIVVISFFAGNNLLKAEIVAQDYAGESVFYLISPIGRSEYNNLGVVDLKGAKVNLVTFKTKVLFFEDTEKIYSEPESLLPIRIERFISKLWIKEYITEEYDQKKFTVTLRKFKKDKIIYEKITQAKGPIHNAITLPFNLRGRFDLKVGWHFTTRIPEEFVLQLVSIDQVNIPAGKFQAYHFKSIPDKFEIWINKNNPRVPLKIQGKGIFDYVLLMKKYVFANISTQTP